MTLTGVCAVLACETTMTVALLNVTGSYELTLRRFSDCFLLMLYDGTLSC